jgi:xylulokinase
MMNSYIASFDIGTTAIKGILINQDAEIFSEFSINLSTILGNQGEKEQNPEDWWEGICTIAHKWWQVDGVDSKKIKMITFSGQMEDVIPITNDLEHQPNAILYSDYRAKNEAEMINNLFPKHSLTTGNGISPSTPLAKIIWFSKHQHTLDKLVHHFLFSSKDYVIYKLTNSFVSDPVTCSTTGMMNITTKKWDESILASLKIDSNRLPSILYPDEIAGFVTKKASEKTGFLEGTPVLCGCGDAGATTIGAAAIREGDSYIYLGTTGWVAVASKLPARKNSGVFNLTHLPKNLYISIAPLLNAGNVHQWAVDSFIGPEIKNKYEEFENILENTEAGAEGVIFLPYLQGERCYIQDPDARGAFWGIHPGIKKEHFSKAVIEGLCFSIRQTLDVLISNKEGNITLIGGGTKSKAWCQSLADILGKTIKVPADSEFLPSIGAASSAFVKSGWSNSYEDFVDNYLKNLDVKEYVPNEEHYSIYRDQYEKFTKLYPSLKNVYSN